MGRRWAQNKELDPGSTRDTWRPETTSTALKSSLAQHITALGFFDAMIGQYAGRLNPTALWMGATALYR